MIKVKALIEFNDYNGKEITKENEYVVRKIGEEFEVDKERAEYLKKNNAVELIEIIPEEENVPEVMEVTSLEDTTKQYEVNPFENKKSTKKSKKKGK